MQLSAMAGECAGMSPVASGIVRTPEHYCVTKKHSRQGECRQFIQGGRRQG